jgi:hypothetical protein
MITIFAMIKKRPEMTDEQFHAHWRHPHGTLTCSVPQIRAYVQNHGIGSTPALHGLEFTGHLGVPVIKVDLLSDLAAMFSSPGFNAVRDDAISLYDQNDFVWLVTREVCQKTPPALLGVTAPVNALMFLSRSVRCETSEFQERVEKLAIAICDSAPNQCGFCVSLADVQYYSGTEGPPFDAVVEILLEDLAAFERHWMSPVGQRLIATALSDFLEPSKTRGFLALKEIYS